MTRGGDDDDDLIEQMHTIDRVTRVADTLRDSTPSLTAPTRASRPSLPGYEVGEALGVGGMGEVLVAREAELDRDVAIKRLRSENPHDLEVARFLREARIQARLDHPAIVPVHRVGRDEAGQPYFTMKRLAGTTLANALEVNPAPALPRLLRAFVDVCLAIEFAHTRRVVHRDLKPGNIVLGDYGEVYVLDWGLARVIDQRVDETSPSRNGAVEAGLTTAGEVFGTPGYMSPEQIHDASSVGPAGDVYSLGSVLFEILAGEPLHPRTDAAIATTLDEPTQSPASRAPERAIAPELDAACTAALAADAVQRPTARALADSIQRYLDGDRDVAQRRSLAATELATAGIAARDPARRAEAMRTAARALALDPESKAAATLVGQLMLEPPRELSPELARHLTAIDELDAQRSSRNGGIASLGFLIGIPLALWTGITSWTLFALFYAVVAASTIYAFLEARRRHYGDVVPLLLNAGLAALLGRMLGPFVLVPAVLCTIMMSLGALPQLLPRPWLVISIVGGAFMIPIALEALGLIARTWQVSGDHVVLSSPMLSLGGAPTGTLLIVTNLAVVLVGTMFGRALIATRREAQHRAEIQAWHLRQLLPPGGTPKTGQ